MKAQQIKELGEQGEPKMEYEKKPNAKLSADDVGKIWAAARRGERARDLAYFFKVSTETIRRILRGDTWTQLTHVNAMQSKESVEAAGMRLHREIEEAKRIKEEMSRPQSNPMEEGEV
jgi:hypothetical protein